MPGASENTRRVEILNANWTPGTAESEGTFEVLMVTEDGERHVAPASVAAITALASLVSTEPVLAWDPDSQSLIIANIIGTMPWTRAEAS